MRSGMRKPVFTAVVLLAVLCAVASLQAQDKGSFSGIVLLDSNKPLAGAAVNYNNLPKFICTVAGCYYETPRVNGTVFSNADGSFTVSNVPVGQYALCASAPRPYLRSCDWGQATTGLQVSANAATPPVTLNIRTGAFVTFNINDPSGLIQHQKIPNGPDDTNLGIGVVAHLNPAGGSDNYAARYVGNSGSTWTYQVAVLIGAPLQIFISTLAPMKILDQSGQPVPINKETGSIQANDTSGTTVNLTVQPSGQVVTGAVTNGASFLPGVAPGSIATVFDQGITNVSGIVTANSLPLPTEIGGTSVSINGARVPLFAVANVNGQQQVNFQVPSGLTAPGISVVVNNNGVERPPISSNVFPAFPGIFTVDGSHGAILHGSDFRLVTTTDPAIRGEPVLIYATGLGAVNPDPGPGNPASASLLSPTVNPVLATVGGVSAPVAFSGLAPGFVGLDQVNIQIPPGSPVGDVDVSLSVVIDGITYSSPPVKLAVQ